MVSFESLCSKERNHRLAVSNEDPNNLGSDLKGKETSNPPDARCPTEVLNSFSDFSCSSE